MSVKGRPVKSLQIKKLQGTLHKERTKEEIVFNLITKVPKPEVWLDDKAKKYFKNICELLISKKLLNDANIPLVLIMAQEFATYEEATRELKFIPGKGVPDNEGYIEEKGGKVIITNTGYQQPSPWIAIRNNAQKNYRDIASLFGLDPLSAQKIGAPLRGEKDPFDEMQKRFE